MKNILLVFALFFGYNTSQAQDSTKKEVLLTMLNSKEIATLLNLSDLKDRAAIRIVDKTGEFNSLDFSFKLDTIKKGGFLIAKTITEVPIDWNTGYYRDFCISSLEKLEKNKYKIDIYISNYVCQDKKKNRLVFRAEYCLKEGKVVISYTELNMWH